MTHNDAAAVVVLTTAPLDLDVAPLARMLLAEQLVACVNILPPMESFYRWQGAIVSATERQLLLKTTVACVERLRERLHALHPYDVPEFLVLHPSGGSKAYLEWIRAETRAPE